MASPWSIVARTEYLEGVRSRWFLFTTFGVPVLFAAMGAFSSSLQSQVREKPAHVVLVDRSDPPLGDVVRRTLEAPEGGKAQFAVDLAPPDEDSAALEARVNAGAIDGYLVLPRDAASGGRALYRGTNASSLGEMRHLGERAPRRRDRRPGAEARVERE